MIERTSDQVESSRKAWDKIVRKYKPYIDHSLSLSRGSPQSRTHQPVLSAADLEAASFLREALLTLGFPEELKHWLEIAQQSPRATGGDGNPPESFYNSCATLLAFALKGIAKSRRGPLPELPSTLVSGHRTHQVSGHRTHQCHHLVIRAAASHLKARRLGKEPLTDLEVSKCGGW
jgi:hypothetical protein